MQKVLILELKKHRRSLPSALALVMAAVAVVLFGGAVLHQWTRETGLWVGFAISLGSVPFFGLLFGVMSGVGLRLNPMKVSEEVLPVTPAEKIWGAYLASLLFLSALLLFAGAYSLFQGGTPLFSPEIMVFLSLVLQIHFLGFACGYRMGNHMLAGGTAILIGGGELFAFNPSMRPFETFFWHSSPLLFAGNVLFTFIAGFYALTRISARIEVARKISVAQTIVFFLALSPGIVVFPLYSRWEVLYKQYRNYSQLFEPDVQSMTNSELADSTRPKERSGIILGYTSSETLLWMGMDRRRRIIYGDGIPSSFLKFALKPESKSRSLPSTFLDDNGTVWAIVNTGSKKQIMKGSSRDSMTLYTTFQSSDFSIQQNGLATFLVRDDSLAVMPEKGKNPDWEAENEMLKSGLQDSVKEGRMAELMEQGKVLTQKLPSGEERSWRLPGKGLTYQALGFAPPAFGTGSDLAFVLPVRKEDGAVTMALCLPGETVRIPWDFYWNSASDSDPGVRRWTIPGGGTVWETASASLVIGADGHVFPALRNQTYHGRYHRLVGSNLWVVEDCLYIVHVINLESGKVVETYSLSGHVCNQWSSDGIYFGVHSQGVHLLTWSGQVLDI